MSRPGTPLDLSPAEQLAEFVGWAGPLASDDDRARVDRSARDLRLALTDEERAIYAALSTPARVQSFLNELLYYNDDHVHPDQDETAMSPRRVLETGRAHCFEGALLAYGANLLHGHAPRMVLLEAIQDVEHNLVVTRDPSGRWGSNAHSSYLHLDGRPAEFPSLRDLVASYHPWYYTGRTMDRADLVLMGWSEPFALEERFGAGWITSPDPLWCLYFTYIDASITFHYLDLALDRPHRYPLVEALDRGWIRVVDGARGEVVPSALPDEARALWDAFFRVHDPSHPRPRGEALALERAFYARTGTTPIDLLDNADDLRWFLEAGFRVDDILCYDGDRNRRRAWNP